VRAEKKWRYPKTPWTQREREMAERRKISRKTEQF